MSAAADAVSIAAAVAGGHRGARTVVAESLDRIERIDGRVNAFTDVLAERALARADSVDAAIRA
ncbi:MAG: AtzE family amidohydrolase, partial [Parafilimonas terrae]|nr:AtzE family amidohydrolase [Parafilimonas terrae]